MMLKNTNFKGYHLVIVAKMDLQFDQKIAMNSEMKDC
jgi:hypothetical protein